MTFNTASSWFEWQCNGTDGNISCHTVSQISPIVGACDSAATTGTFVALPSNINYCSAGYANPDPPNLVAVPPPPAVPTHQEWQWTCMGINGGGNSGICSAAKTSNDNGDCLAVAPAASTTPPDGVGCQAGTQSSVTVPTAAPWDYSWTCGTAPGTVVTCTSPMMRVDAACGSFASGSEIVSPVYNPLQEQTYLNSHTSVTFINYAATTQRLTAASILNALNGNSISSCSVGTFDTTYFPFALSPSVVGRTSEEYVSWKCHNTNLGDPILCFARGCTLNDGSCYGISPTTTTIPGPLVFTQNNCVDLTYTGTGDNLCSSNQYVAGVQDSIGGIDRQHGMDGVVCCDSPPSVGYSSCEPGFSYTGTGQNFCSMGNVMLGIWDDGGGMDGMNGPVCCTPTLPVGRSNCVDVYYSGNSRIMCPVGKYAAGMHDNGGGSDGVNGIICCDP